VGSANDLKAESLIEFRRTNASDEEKLGASKAARNDSGAVSCQPLDRAPESLGPKTLAFLPEER
jgi:hypothetical protein